MDGWKKSGMMDGVDEALCGEECDCVYMMLKGMCSMKGRQYNDISRVDKAIVYFWYKEMVCALRPKLADNGCSAV